MVHQEFSPIRGDLIEDIYCGVNEPGKQRPSRNEDAKHLAPHGANVGHETVGTRMHDEIESCVIERAQIAHVAFDNLDREILPSGDHSILGELARRVVEYGNSCTSSRQDRTLLAACARETKCSGAGERGKPFSRDWPTWREQNLPVPAAGGLDDLRSNR